MKKLFLFSTISLVLLSSCGSNDFLQYDDQLLFDGMYENISVTPDEYGFYDYASIMTYDNKIVAVYCDSFSEIGDGKYSLSLADLYPMSGFQIAPFHEQIDAFSDFVMQNQSVFDNSNSTKYTDAISGCTISVKTHSNLIADMLLDPEFYFKPIETNQSVFADGEYTKMSENTDEFGFFATATVAFKDEYLVNVFLDSINSDGVSMRQLSIDQNTDWHKQIDAYADFILKKQYVPTADFNSDGTINTLDGVIIPVAEHGLLVSDLLNRTN